MMPQPSNTKSSWAFILVTVLIDTVGIGIVLPVFPELVTELTGEGLGVAATYGGWMVFVYALMQFVFSPILGSLSDHFGRRPVLLISLLAFALDYSLMGLAPSIEWIFVGRAFAGVFGATHATANAYVADVTRPEERAQKFGMVGAAFGLGFIIGPLLGGMLGQFGPRVPFFAAAAIALVNGLYGIVVLPESLPREARRPFSWKRGTTFGSLRQLRRDPLVLGLAATTMLFAFGNQANPHTWTYFTMLKFGWSSLQVGYSLAFVGILMAGVQGGLTGKLIPLIGEMRTIHLGLVAAMVGYLGFAFLPQAWMLYVVAVPWSLCGLTMPALQAMMSRRVAENAQGELQGAISSLLGLNTIIAPPVLTQLFGYFSSSDAPVYFPGAAYLAATLATLFAGMLFWRVTKGLPARS